MPLTIWRVTDGRAGHENMTLGLTEALARRTPVEVRELRARGLLSALASGLAAAGRAAPRGGEPRPLVLGAGHRSHATLLATARRERARSIVLLRPSLPLGWFDLCLIPAHDHPPPLPNVLVTDGVLTRLRPGRRGRRGAKLILIGGPSAHHSWLDRELLAQLERLAARGGSWVAATSRRTPQSFVRLLTEQRPPNLALKTPDAVDRDWLPGQLARAPEVWVTEDSVSMIYEALSAGAATGVLRIPRRGADRVVNAVCALILTGRVTLFDPAGPAPRAAPALQEAERCAAWICRHWLAPR